MYNDFNYPNLNGLFDELDVQSSSTEMSFSVSVDDGETEWYVGLFNGWPALEGLFSRALRRRTRNWSTTYQRLVLSLDTYDARPWPFRSGTGLNGVFACRRHITSPYFLTMMRDVIRFNKEAPELLRLSPTDPQRSQTMGQYCDAKGYRCVCLGIFFYTLDFAIQ